ncbi:MAG TPA: hypothetical protein DIT64_09010 [Verrucomicrobiales bacterium]|nr:hypothetical protein [Verrucomicrobiales bacterium]
MAIVKAAVGGLERLFFALEMPGKPDEVPRPMTHSFRKIARISGLAGLTALAAVNAGAQASLEERRQAARELEQRLPKPEAAIAGTGDMAAARQARLRQLLPESTRRLLQREPFHLLMLGDAAPVWPEEGDSPGGAPAFDEVFAHDLAALFFYTGGVRIAGKDQPGVELGPALVLRNLSKPGGSVLDAPGILASTARQTPVNLVLLCLGQAEAGMAPVVFSRAVREAVSAAREMGAEVILASSWPPMSAASEHVLGLARPAADALAEIAVEHGLPFVDLGGLRGIMDAPPLEAGQDVAHWFAEVERVYRGFFHDSGAGFIPRASLHGRLGAALADQLLDGPPAVPWSMGKCEAELDAQGRGLRVSWMLENTTKEPLDLIALPLIAGGWRPVEAVPAVRIKPGESTELEATFARAQPAAVDEPLVRLPVLLSGGGSLEIAGLRCRLQPAAVVWEMETFFNQESAISPACVLVNHGKRPLKGSWQAGFNGATLKGQYDVPAGASQTLDIRFELPSDASGRALPLSLRLEGDFKHESTRSLRLTPNLGLGTARPLAASDPALDGKAALTAHADASTLTLMLDLADSGLLTDSPAGPAWELLLRLDARSYGKRLESGAAAALRVSGPAVDGPGKVDHVPAWAFGTGYAAGFDPAEFKAELLTLQESRRQIRLTVPRTYLYLHEWALENGNSQLGINLRLRLNGEDGGAVFDLSPTRKPSDAVDALVVLELAKQPTRRFTVSVE